MKKLQQPAVLSTLLVVAIIVSIFSLFQYQKTQAELKKLKQNPQVATQEKIKATIDKARKLIALPSETPTLATITDIAKLKDQPFFAKAKNGDKILIFTQAKKAILYRESENKIIDVAPINIGTSSVAQSQQAKIALINGTDVAGLAKKVETQLTTAFQGVKIVSKTDARGNYDKTIAIVLNDGAKTAVDNLAKNLGGTVGGLPSKESRPSNADILIIIGKDYIKR